MFCTLVRPPTFAQGLRLRLLEFQLIIAVGPVIWLHFTTMAQTVPTNLMFDDRNEWGQDRAFIPPTAYSKPDRNVV